MKHIHILKLAILSLPFVFPVMVNGQDFLNGSFEQNGNLCLINASTKVFNANVKNTRVFGSLGKPDIASSDCGSGDAKDGNWFVGLATNIQGGVKSEGMTLALNAPLEKGGQYSITFWARMRSYAPDIELGQSVGDSLRGDVFYTVSAQTIGTDWTEITLRFTAPNDGKYISVRATNPNMNSGVWLDGFKIHQVFQADNIVMVSKTTPANNVEAKKDAASSFGLFPNPSEGIFKVITDSSTLQSITVYDMLGSTVEQHVATVNQPVPDKIDLTDQQPGMYFVEMATISGEKMTRRIIVSR
jgi:hypothetical protein